MRIRSLFYVEVNYLLVRRMREILVHILRKKYNCEDSIAKDELLEELNCIYKRDILIRTLTDYPSLRNYYLDDLISFIKIDFMVGDL